MTAGAVASSSPLPSAVRLPHLGALHRLGLPGALGALLLAAASALVFVHLPQLEDEAQDVAGRTRAALRDAPRAGAASALAGRDPAADFVGGFPDETSRQQRVSDLLAHAAEHGVRADRTEYRYSVDATLGLAQYRITMPVEAPYPALRGFIAQALRDDPALSLDSLRLRRPDVQQPQWRAELGWTLHMQAEPAAGRATR